MMLKRWNFLQADTAIVDQLFSTLKIHPVFCKMLAVRGISTFDEAKQFFRASEAHLHHPMLMKDMPEAVERLHKAIVEQENILIYGDYDVDGTTAVATVYSFIRTLTPHVNYYIPHRFTEGYGISEKGIQTAIDEQVSLLITLDCGIQSVSHIQHAAQHGIDTIICDHHFPGEILPPALAILNPKQPLCNYPYKELCGCGIGFKFISAYAQTYGIDPSITYTHLDLLATAIAADIVPITGENRTLCMLGLAKANTQPGIPLQALRHVSELQKPFTINDLVFIIGPRVNAAGRMDDARKAVELFIETDVTRAIELANVLHEDNNDRKDIDRATTQEALALIENDPQAKFRKSTVVYEPHWHKGIVGIVASRLIEHHYRPTIVLTQSNGKITGSARSIKGFNLFEGLQQCSHLLENFGGHYFAAGLTLPSANFSAFQTAFESVVNETLTDEDFKPQIDIDATLQFNDINESFMQILEQFAPHGPQNMKPIFRSTMVQDYQGMTSIVKEKHIRFVVYQQGHKTMNGIGFNLADKYAIIQEKKSFEILYQLEENEWNGYKNIQLKVIDIR